MTLRIIAGIYKGRTLKTPKSPHTRPTQGIVREALFNICQSLIEGARFLDCFAGSGAIGLEALSRGAAHTTFVEHHPAALRCIQDNIATLQCARQTTLLRSPKQLIPSFEIAYLDPPYDTPLDLAPFAPLLAPHALLFVEAKTTPSPCPQFHHIDTRRFGIALLHQYQRSS